MKRVYLPLALGLLFAGCPGDLENPDCFPAQSAPLCTLDADQFNIEEYFVNSCGTSTCHGSDHPPDGENAVDLESAGIFARLTAQIASAPACNELGIPIIDTANWQNSFLIRKLRGQHGSCGDRMPFDGVIPQPQLQCIGRWLVQGGGELETSVMSGQCATQSDNTRSPDSGMSAMMGEMATDAGPTEDAAPTETTFDCAAITAGGLMLCQTNSDGCEAISNGDNDCNATCALAGLQCVRSVPDDAEACAPEAGGADSGCNQEDRAADYCFCGTPS